MKWVAVRTPLVIVMNLDANANHFAGISPKHLIASKGKTRRCWFGNFGSTCECGRSRWLRFPLVIDPVMWLVSYLLDQWFVNMKPLAVPALEVVERWNSFCAWAFTENLSRFGLSPFKDWCILRQFSGGDTSNLLGMWWVKTEGVRKARYTVCGGAEIWSCRSRVTQNIKNQ
jgi:hypothetical protein